MGNPLKYVDPTGLDPCLTDECITVTDLGGFFDFLSASAFFLNGAVNSLSSNFLLGRGRYEYDNAAYKNGQRFGDAASIPIGAAATMQGGEGFLFGTALDLTGEGMILGVPIQIVSGVVAVDGGLAAAFGTAHLMAANGESGGSGGQPLLRGKNAVKEAVKRLGLDPVKASEALHAAKRSVGRGGADNVLIDPRNGNIISPQTGEIIGNLGN
jgi:hypothetical protein